MPNQCSADGSLSRYAGLIEIGSTVPSHGAASDASTIASTAQQLSISFGIAFASLVTGWFLGGIDRSNAGLLVPALHKAYLLLGAVTVASATTFLTLKRGDGSNVSGHGQESD